MKDIFEDGLHMTHENISTQLFRSNMRLSYVPMCFLLVWLQNKCDSYYFRFEV